MPRGFTVAQLESLSSRVKRPAMFAKLELAGADVTIWNGVGNISFGGDVYHGVGEYGIIRGLETNSSLRAPAIEIALTGLPASFITDGIVETTRVDPPQGRPLTISLGFVDAAEVLLHTPLVVWKGVADVLSFRVGETFTCTLTGEHYASKLRTENGLRMTEKSHNQRLGNPATVDTFFSFQSRLLGAPRPRA